MSIDMIWTCAGLLSVYAIVLGGLEHASKANVRFEHRPAYGAIRGHVIPPFRG
jgi:hypothetical protein